MKRYCLSIVSLVLVSGAAQVAASEPVIEQAPTHYSATTPETPLAEIAERISSGEKLLVGNTDREILLELLELLHIPVESQVLVFSKTSEQNSHISPSTPRAIYFSDNAYVGWVLGGDLEVVTFDPRLGAIFNLINLKDRPLQASPEIVRDRSCLSCHAGSATGGFPGVMVRSVYASESGHPYFQAGTFQTTHSSPLSERWGGWYVTGSSGEQAHMGNRLAHAPNQRRQPELIPMVTGDTQELDSSLFPTHLYAWGGRSDIVALMILEHQVTVHNVLVEANLSVRHWLHRQQQVTEALGGTISSATAETTNKVLQSHANRIVDVLLFKDEFIMQAEGVEGDEAFQNAFMAQAKPSRHQQSLRDLRLYERLFKNRCSYMIYSDAFAHLPDALRQRVWRNLRTTLTGDPETGEFSYLGASERKRIIDILVDTCPEWNAME